MTHDRPRRQSVWPSACRATFALAPLRVAFALALPLVLSACPPEADASSPRPRPPIAPTVFWGPMAFSIMGGLLVATILTLVFLPTLYVTWFGGKQQPATQT